MQIRLVDGNLQREMWRCTDLERSICHCAWDQPLHQHQLFLSMQVCADLTTKCQCMESSKNFFSVLYTHIEYILKNIYIFFLTYTFYIYIYILSIYFLKYILVVGIFFCKSSGAAAISPVICRVMLPFPVPFFQFKNLCSNMRGVLSAGVQGSWERNLKYMSGRSYVLDGNLAV